MKIYTKTGDSGTTGLFAGPRVFKDDPRIAAYGAVDELNALLGVLLAAEAAGPDQAGKAAYPPRWQDLRGIQGDLFSIGAELATPNSRQQGMCLLTEKRVLDLEQWIDEVDATLEPLTSFILPGGSKAAGMFHLARTVCRRAERETVHFAQLHSEQECSIVVIYLNRLSDLLFVLARQANQLAGIPDVPWTRPRADQA